MIALRSPILLTILLTIVLALGLVASGRPALAQGATPPAPAQEAPASFVEASRIPESTEALQQILRRFSEASSVEPAVASLEDELPALTAQIELHWNQTRELLSATPTHEQLRALERDWNRGLGSLTLRRRTLAARAENLQQDATELAHLEKLWRHTLENATETGTPSEMIAMIRSNLETIEAVSQKVKQRRNRVLRLLTMVGEQEYEASEAIRRISDKRIELRSQIFEADAAPLWSAVPQSDTSAIIDQVVENAKKEWVAFVDFSTAHQRSFWLVGFTFVLSLLLAVFMRDRMRRRVIDGRLEGSSSVFERPISVAILATIVVVDSTIPFLPGLGRHLAGIVLLVPVLRLVTPVAMEMPQGLLGILATFYLTDRLRDMIEPAVLAERSLFLAEMVAAFLVVALLVRPSRLTALRESNAPPAAVGIGLRVAMGAFLISAFANLFGYLAFAKLIGNGALRSIDLALVAYAGYRISVTLVAILFASNRLRRIGAFRNHGEQVAGWVDRILAFAAVLAWTLETLDYFSVRDIVLGSAAAVISTPVEIGTLSISLWDVAAFPLTLFAAYLLSRAIRSLLEEDVFPRISLHRGVDNAVSTTIHYALLLAGFFVALGASGIDLGKFAILAGALGVGIGFGLQSIVNNFVSGLILLYERPIKVGDTIELTGLLGEVKRIGIRASTILTFQGAEVIIPNGNLLSDQLINWTLSNKHRRVEIPVGVAYGNTPADVIEVLKQVLDREPRILRNPEPMVLFRGFGESSLDFELRFWAREYLTYLALASDVAAAVYDELAAVGISIPFPQRDLHIKSMDAATIDRLRSPET